MRPGLSLSDSSTAIILDASVVINLNATGWTRQILGAIPFDVLLVDVVHDEVDAGRLRGLADAELTSQIISEGLFNVVALGEVGQQYFEKLVSGSSTATLDDGEAATIAYALETRAVAVIDERKALRICDDRFKDLDTASTLDVLAHPQVEEVLGREVMAESVLNALRRARMRVPEHLLPWVIDLIGPEKAAQCSSLPRSVRQEPAG